MDAIIKFTIRRGEIHLREQGKNVYGIFVTTLNLIMKNIYHYFSLYNQKGQKLENCYIMFTKESFLKTSHTFSEYLKAGWKINMSVAIDYSASNGDIESTDSLHRVCVGNETMN